MTVAIRAQIVDDFRFGGAGVSCRIVVADLDDQGRIFHTRQVLHYSDGIWAWHLITDEERYISPPHNDPSILSFPEGVGEALLEALSRHFHGTTSAQELRADVRHERTRRDTAEDRVFDLAIRFADRASMSGNQESLALSKLADHLPALSLAVSSAPPPVGNPPLLHHPQPGCRGHMPWDFTSEHCGLHSM